MKVAHEDPGEASSSSTLIQVETYLTEQTIPAYSGTGS